MRMEIQLNSVTAINRSEWSATLPGFLTPVKTAYGGWAQELIWTLCQKHISLHPL